MADGVVTVDLVRDGQATAWGFRLQGGYDVGLPLTIQRVFLGSPSEGELHRGDVILMIGNKKTDNMTHQEASDIFRKAGNNLRLMVHRTMRSGSTTPIPYSFSGSPLSHLGGTPTTMYHFVASPPSAGSTPPPPLTKPGDYVFRPLPTTQFSDSYSPYTLDPQTVTTEENQEYVMEKHRERQSIVSQAHRTFPLITPHAKPRHDLPTGSYLRFVQDPSWKVSNHPSASKINEALMLQKLQDTVKSTASSSVSSCSPGRTPTPDSAALGGGPKVVHKQYNSPLNLYSAETITEALVGQSSIQQPTFGEALRDLILCVAPVVRSEQ
uniref:PDZ and LIM domain protein 7 n=1 Tax=Hadrurus spadix TaxID=141984 RepID=A0A1W7R9Z1_9SCOR